MLAILAAAAALTATPVQSAKAAISVAPSAKTCGYWQLKPVRGNRAPSGRAQQLGDLPKANHELTVLRTDENGCSKPVVVREDVSGDGRFAKPR